MKGNLLQGTARGKMGEIVARVVHGEQILSKYQPNVAKSNSELVIQTKEKFAKAVEFTKLTKKTASIKLPYSVYLGSAKNMRSALIKQSLLAFDCFPVNGIGLRQTKPRQSAIFYKDLPTSWGNKFEVEISSSGIPSLVGSTVGLGNYFGSDIPLEAETFDFRTTIINMINPENGHSLIEISASKIDDLRLVSVPAGDQDEGKNFGIYETVEECGNWNFYYNFKYAALVDPGALSDISVPVGEDVPGITKGLYQCAHFMVVNRNTLLSYDFEEYYVAPYLPAPTP
jgi:Ni2+-binding GTPase involved in maturation of urease and hydrogenase